MSAVDLERLTGHRHPTRVIEPSPALGLWGDWCDECGVHLVYEPEGTAIERTPTARPGVYDTDTVPIDAYHWGPLSWAALSSTGARMLNPRNGPPARFAWWRSRGRPPTTAYEFGHAAHHLVLGVGHELVEVKHDSWRTKDAQDQQKKARAAGQIPLLTKQFEQAHAMAQALREHPFAGSLFAPGTGQPEQTLIWQDERTGIMRRVRLDWLPTMAVDGRRMIPADYKTCDDATEVACQRAVSNYGYHQQAAWQIDAIQALDLARDVAPVQVFQEKHPPYLVHVTEPDVTALRIGAYLNREAIDIYAECTQAGHWPGYDDPTLLPLPVWVEREFEGVI